MTMSSAAAVVDAAQLLAALRTAAPTPAPGTESFQVRWVDKAGRSRVERFATEPQAHRRFMKGVLSGEFGPGSTMVEREGRGWKVRSSVTRSGRASAGISTGAKKRRWTPTERAAVLRRLGMTPSEREQALRRRAR